VAFVILVLNQNKNFANLAKKQLKKQKKWQNL
jgi:hypothetical protein